MNSINVLGWFDPMNSHPIVFNVLGWFDPMNSMFIAEDVIKRRYQTGWENFQKLYAPLVDAWAVYDNNDEQTVLVEWSEKYEGK